MRKNWRALGLQRLRTSFERISSLALRSASSFLANRLNKKGALNTTESTGVFIPFNITIGSDVYPFPKVELVKTVIGTNGLPLWKVQELMEIVAKQIALDEDKILNFHEIDFFGEVLAADMLMLSELFKLDYGTLISWRKEVVPLKESSYIKMRFLIELDKHPKFHPED